MMAAVWIRILLLALGWAASAAIALIAELLFGLPKLTVLLTGGIVWTCLLLRPGFESESTALNAFQLAAKAALASQTSPSARLS